MGWKEDNRGAGPWEFAPQQDKWGYLNNKRWTQLQSAIDFSNFVGNPVDLTNEHRPCGHWHKTQELTIPPTTPVPDYIFTIVVGMNTETGRLVNLSSNPLDRIGTFDNSTDVINTVARCYGVTYDYTNGIVYMGVNVNSVFGDAQKIVKVDLATMTSIDELVLTTSNHLVLQSMNDHPENGLFYTVIRDNNLPYTATLYEISIATFTVTRTLIFSNPPPSQQTNGLFPDSARGYLYYRGTGFSPAESYIRRVNLTTFTEDATTCQVSNPAFFFGIYGDMVYDKSVGRLYCAYESAENPPGVIDQSSWAEVNVDTMTVINTAIASQTPIGNDIIPIKLALSDNYIFNMRDYVYSGGEYYLYFEVVSRTTLASLGFYRLGPYASDTIFPYIVGDLNSFDDKLFLYFGASSIDGDYAVYVSYDVSNDVPVYLDSEFFLDLNYEEVGDSSSTLLVSKAPTGVITSPPTTSAPDLSIDEPQVWPMD